MIKEQNQEMRQNKEQILSEPMQSETTTGPEKPKKGRWEHQLTMDLRRLENKWKAQIGLVQGLRCPNKCNETQKDYQLIQGLRCLEKYYGTQLGHQCVPSLINSGVCSGEKKGHWEIQDLRCLKTGNGTQRGHCVQKSWSHLESVQDLRYLENNNGTQSGH